MAARSDQALRRVGAAFLAQIDAMIPLSGAETSANRTRAGVAMVLLTDALQTLSQPTATRPDSISDHLRHRRMARATLTEVGRSAVGNDPTEALVRQARRLYADLSAELGRASLPACVDTLFGVARTSDHLRGALIDLVILALNHGLSATPSAMVETTRALCAALGERYPGAAIEVRVPPAAAVQLGALGQGPTHTRGTPPNVVETDMDTFIRLAVGLLGWQDARASGKVSASGAHVDDVASMLPVVDAQHDLRF